MTNEEMRELDEWLALHVMCFQRIEMDDEIYLHGDDNSYALEDWFPTRSSCHALKVLKKCAEKISTAAIEIYQGVDEGPEFKPLWCITRKDSKTVVMAPTLELAIAKFAKELFKPSSV